MHEMLFETSFTIYIVHSNINVYIRDGDIILILTLSIVFCLLLLL